MPSSSRRPLRTMVHCKICGDVLDSDRVRYYAECCCRNAHMDSSGACGCYDPATVDVDIEYAESAPTPN